MIAQTIGSTQHPSLIRPRLDHRSFSTRKVDLRNLLLLLEAARWTVSFRNEQPWSFIITGNDDLPAYEGLLSCLAESNITWARRAPVLMLLVVKLNFDDGQRNPYAFHDAGKALSNLRLRAKGMGMLVHPMSGFDAARARSLFSIPGGYAPVAIIAIGHPDHVDRVDAPTQREASNRRPLDSQVFVDRWGQSSTLFAGMSNDPCYDGDNS